MEEVLTKRLTSSADHLVVTPEEELAEFEACQRANDEWNNKIAVERDQRLAVQMSERRDFIATRLELKEEREREALLAAEEIVRKEKVCTLQFKTCKMIFNDTFLFTGTIENIHFERELRSSHRVCTS